LTLSRSFAAFLGLSFVCGLLTVTPQLMFPLSAQYAPARHRAIMISIIMSGLVFGMLVARLLSGIVAQYSSWRAVYWMSLGLQLATLLLVFALMPSYPILRAGTSYPRILLKIVTLPFHHPVLTQHSLIGFLTGAMFTSFWTTLTFQLASPAFDLSTLAIGLFALIGISPVLLNPLISRHLTSRLHPSGTLLIALPIALAAILVGTFVGTFSLAGPVIWAFLGDLGMNTCVVANRMALVHVSPRAQNAVNSVYMVFTFSGMLFGTAVGNRLYAQGGWTHSGGLGIAVIGSAIVLVLLRGPHERRWVGWRGGWDLRDKEVGEVETETEQSDVEARAVSADATVRDATDEIAVVAGQPSTSVFEERVGGVDAEKKDEVQVR
jgi:predicted MFS family arabinose efflux permease